MWAGKSGENFCRQILNILPGILAQFYLRWQWRSIQFQDHRPIEQRAILFAKASGWPRHQIPIDKWPKLPQHLWLVWPFGRISPLRIFANFCSLRRWSRPTYAWFWALGAQMGKSKWPIWHLWESEKKCLIVKDMKPNKSQIHGEHNAFNLACFWLWEQFDVLKKNSRMPLD